MILLCGIPSESPLELVRRELDRLGAPHLIFNQRRFADSTLEWELTAGVVAGDLRIGSRSYNLAEIRGVYTRLMDDTILPELEHSPPDSPLRRHCRSLHDALYRWYEICPARVVNRSDPQGSNSSKPYQAQLIARHGFSTPETLVTNQPELVREFARVHGQLVYKSISGARSIVKILTDLDLQRLDQIRWCPVQFQAYIPGNNLRVHIVGERVFATEITSSVTDYRYATSGGETAILRAYELPDAVAEACISLAASLRLPFAGIDLKLAPDGQLFCLEVNPNPAFSYYEANTGQPIARALAKYLAAG